MPIPSSKDTRIVEVTTLLSSWHQYYQFCINMSHLKLDRAMNVLILDMDS